jgi:hypothetical protein
MFQPMSCPSNFAGFLQDSIRDARSMNIFRVGLPSSLSRMPSSGPYTPFSALPMVVSLETSITMSHSILVDKSNPMFHSCHRTMAHNR